MIAPGKGFERQTIEQALEAVKADLAAARAAAEATRGDRGARGRAVEEGTRCAEAKKQTRRWQDVRKDLLHICDEGEPYTSQGELAKRLRCSPATINRVFRESPNLRKWMREAGRRAPRAQSITPVMQDSVADVREPSPKDALLKEEIDRIMARLIEQSKPEERAELNALDDQGRAEMARTYLEQEDDRRREEEDPKGNRLLGRRP